MASMVVHICLKECKWRAPLFVICIFSVLNRVFAFVIRTYSVNVVEGEPSERQMTTGNHTVRDIYCVKCNTILGWKYVSR